MIKTTLVTETKLFRYNNQQLYDYFDEFSKTFNFLVRRTIHHLRKNLNGQKEAAYRSQMMKDFDLSNRAAKAIIRTSKNLLSLINESNKYQYNTLFRRRSKLTQKINKLKTTIDKNNRHKDKVKLFWLQMKLNKTNQLIDNGIKFKSTFGTNKYLKNNRGKFFAKRDNQIIYIGSKQETCGNLQFQISYNSRYNSFEYKCRYDNKWTINNNKYFYGKFYLTNKKAKDIIRNIIKTPKSEPLTYRIIKRNDELYLQIMYRHETNHKTRDTHGVIGVDFNKGFISIGNIDNKGYLHKLKRILYLHKGKSSKTKQSMLDCVRFLGEYAIKEGKDIVIEDLKSLNRKKNDKKENKEYNRMLNSLKFGMFNKLLKSYGNKHGITVHEVNPYNTSKIAKDKYCMIKKMNVHDGASYVIARRYYNYD